MISIIVPVYNEEKNISQLHSEILTVVKSIGKPYEIIFINDGSTDKTLKLLRSLSPIKIINFRKNFGQTAALDAGIKEARGEIIITMDGDLQNDPSDIPNLIHKLNEGYDVISGWRWQRKDLFSKKIISKGANFLRKFFINDNIHDSGCTLKAYRRECFDNIDLYGEMHRFIPAILIWRGFKVTEIKTNHRPRINGITKYTYTRIIKGMVDMIAVWFWRKFSTRPLHIFGGIGLVMSVIGFFIIALLFFLRLFGIASLASSIWPLASFFMALTGIQLLVSGLLADMIIKNYYRTHECQPYNIKEIIENKLDD